jgi:hypothetical protein
MTTLYVSSFSDNGSICLNIYQGIHEKHSTNSNKVYPAVIYRGSVNIMQRCLYKGNNLPQKIVAQEGDILILSGYDRRCKELSIVLNELGYDQIMLTDIINIVNTVSSDAAVKTYDYYRYDANGSMNGIVNF